MRPPNLGFRFAGQRSRQLGRHGRVLGSDPPPNPELQAITFRDCEPPSHLGVEIQEMGAICGRKRQPLERLPVDGSLDADLCRGAEERNGLAAQLDSEEVPEASDKPSAAGQEVAGRIASCGNAGRRSGSDLSTQLVIRSD